MTYRVLTERKEEERVREKPPLLQANSKFAVMVINQEMNQLAKVAILPAKPFMFTGRIYLPKTTTKQADGRLVKLFRFLVLTTLSSNI